MGNSAESDFPATRSSIERLDEWLTALASPLLPLQQVPAGPAHPDRFRWVFREQSERALVVGKAVRVVSGIRAAMILADMGYVAECGTILRTVSDFSNEMFSITEGVRSGNPTEAQKLFLQQYFTAIASDPDEYDEQEKERFVTRDKLLSAHYRIAAEMKGGTEPDRLRKVLRFIAQGYDKYVHGAYITSMELFYGDSQRFMVRGVPSGEHKEIYKRAVASKLHEGLAALVVIAVGMNMPALAKEIEAVAKELYASGELS